MLTMSCCGKQYYEIERSELEFKKIEPWTKNEWDFPRRDRIRPDTREWVNMSNWPACHRYPFAHYVKELSFGPKEVHCLFCGLELYWINLMISDGMEAMI